MPKARRSKVSRSALRVGAAALFAAVAGCVSAELVPVELGRGLRPSSCPVPVRASIRNVEDRRGSSDPRVLGTSRFSHGWVSSVQTATATRPPAEALRDVLDLTLAGCAPGPDAPGSKLVLDVALAAMQIDQTAYGYDFLNTGSIAFSVRVFDESGARFLDSFDVKEEYKSVTHAGGQPDLQFLADQVLRQGADRFIWDFVPVIRRHGS